MADLENSEINNCEVTPKEKNFEKNESLIINKNKSKNSFFQFLDSKKFNKYFPIIIIVFAAILFALPFLSPTNSLPGGDWRLTHQSTIELMDQSFKDGLLLWVPEIAGGTPFFAVPDKPLSYPPMYFMLLFLPAVAALNWSIVIHVFLAGLFMFLFSKSIFKNDYSATLSAIIYMVSITPLPPFWILSLAWLPLVFLFSKKAMEENWKYSIISALFLSLMFHAGGAFQFFIALFFVSIYVFFLQFKQKFSLKFVFVIIILLVFFLGFSAVRLLPFLEWKDQTSRSGALPYEVTVKNKLDFGNFYSNIIDGKRGKSMLGFLGFSLLLYGTYLAFKKRDIDAKIMVVLLFASFLVVTGIAQPLLYNLPGFNSQRGLIRNLFIFAFFSSILAGYALKYIKRPVLIKIIILIVLLDVFVGSALYPVMEPYSRVQNNNPLIQYISEQDGIFRIHSNEIKGIDYNDIQMLTIPKNIEMLYGILGGIWVPEYLNEILGVALQNPARMWGVMNVKYLTSSTELNVSSFKFIKKFKEDSLSPVDYMDGPYLYENLEVLPRAAYYKDAIVVVGDKPAVYWATLYPDLNTSKIVVIQAKSVKEAISLKPSAVLLTSLNQNDFSLLRRYNGKIFPDVLNGEQNLNNSEFSSFLNSLNSPFEELNVEKDNNHVSITLPEKDGFLFLSEKFTLFPGWNLKINGAKKDYYRADGMVVSTSLSSSDKTALFSYQPSSYKKGLWITFFSFLFAFYVLFKKRFKKH